MIPHSEGFYEARCPKCQGILVSSAQSPGTKRQCPYCGYRYAPVKRKVKV